MTPITAIRQLKQEFPGLKCGVSIDYGDQHNDKWNVAVYWVWYKTGNNTGEYFKGATILEALNKARTKLQGEQNENH